MSSTIVNMKSSCLYELSKQIAACDKFYIYGAGMVGKFIYNYLKDHQEVEKMASFVVSSQQGGGIIPNLI